MKKVLILTGFCLATASALSAAQAQTADKGPVAQNSNAMATADQPDAAKTNIRQQIQDQLTKSGYTDVTVTPSSFYVHAKNKNGDPVAMVIGPESVTEVTETPMAKAATPGATKTQSTSSPAPASKP